MLFGGAGAVTGFGLGAAVGIGRFRELLGLGSIGGVLIGGIWATLSKQDEAWGWAIALVFANLLSYTVFLGLGGGMRALISRASDT